MCASTQGTKNILWRARIKNVPDSRKIETDLTQAQAEYRRGSILKKMLSTPPKPKKQKKGKDD